MRRFITQSGNKEGASWDLVHEPLQKKYKIIIITPSALHKGLEARAEGKVELSVDHRSEAIGMKGGRGRNVTSRWRKQAVLRHRDERVRHVEL